jgi:hypothetical protein
MLTRLHCPWGSRAQQVLVHVLHKARSAVFNCTLLLLFTGLPVLVLGLSCTLSCFGGLLLSCIWLLLLL